MISHGSNNTNLKMSESKTGAGNLKTWKAENFENIKKYPWDMLNKSLFIGENDNDFSSV